MRRPFWKLLLPLALLSAAALAQSHDGDLQQRLTPEQMHATGLDTLTPDQLALLNRLLAEEAAQAQAPAAAPAQPQPAPFFTDESEGPIKSRLVGAISAWSPGTVFVLENGQQWRVLKGARTLRAPLQAPDVAVVPGIAGRRFMQVGDEPMPRVVRIK